MKPLGPGAYLVTLSVAQGVELTRETLAKGLKRAGWEILTVSDDSEGFTFVGRLRRTFQPADTSAISWSDVWPLGFDPFESPPLTFVPYELISEKVHTLWFYARRRSHVSTEAVVKGLLDMGWHVDTVLELQKHAALPERPNVDVGWYVAAARWTRGDSALAGTEDPFFFASVSVASSEHPASCPQPSASEIHP